jgi:hypothetical protein
MKTNVQTKITRNVILGLFIASMTIMNGFSQKIKSNKGDFEYSNTWTVMAGLIQPMVLSGGNFEVNYFGKRTVFDFSHGFSLDPPVVGAVKDQGLVWHLPYSTGLGIGYRLTKSLDVRFEPKLHSYEAYNKGDEQNEANKIAAFKTITMGIGVYYRYFPFKNSESKFLRGLVTASSVRWWQNVGTTLRNDELNYMNKTSGKMEKLEAPNIGLANTPIIINIGIGYSFGGND